MSATTRRRFLAGALLALPLATVAQSAARMPRIGVLAGRPWQKEAFDRGLREHGWIEGQNVLVEYRRAADLSREKAADVVRELAGLKVDCIVAAGNLMVGIAKQSAPSVPLVMAHAADPVGSGFVASLARPGGNVTGHSNINEALTGKRLELLKELDSRLSRIAVLKSPSIIAHDAVWKQAQSSARSLGLKVVAADYGGADGFEAAFAAIGRERADGLLVPQSPAVSAERERIVGLAAKARLSAIYQNSLFVESGGLMSYGADEADLWRRSARYVDRILKGAKPAELPVEQPTKFELVINLKTAKALGLTVPQAFLMRADRVIE